MITPVAQVFAQLILLLWQGLSGNVPPFGTDPQIVIFLSHKARSNGPGAQCIEILYEYLLCIAAD